MSVLAVFKRGRLDPLSDVSPDPTTVQLLGEDGGVGHAVTIVGLWIFDASLPYALPLSRASLDACCSSARGRVAYVCVERAVRYRPVAAPAAPPTLLPCARSADETSSRGAVIPSRHTSARCSVWHVAPYADGW